MLTNQGVGIEEERYLFCERQVFEDNVECVRTLCLDLGDQAVQALADFS